ncbi:MAG: hypothetical protein NWE75_00470 [Candidatus Bathyarchaeota archaeon]|jgi:hypothetical protein|nr:hypothetical protein [Candidatus Bathyarchaeota archaeon]
MKPTERIWWTKIAAAVGVALLTVALQTFLNVSGLLAFMLGVLLYMGLSDVLANINGVDRTRGLKIGVGAYFFTWMMVWILMYTFVQTIA